MTRSSRRANATRRRESARVVLAEAPMRLRDTEGEPEKGLTAGVAVPPPLWPASFSLVRNCGDTKTQVAVPARRRAPAAVRRPAAPAEVVPTAAPDHPVR